MDNTRIIRAEEIELICVPGRVDRFTRTHRVLTPVEIAVLEEEGQVYDTSIPGMTERSTVAIYEYNDKYYIVTYGLVDEAAVKQQPNKYNTVLEKALAFYADVNNYVDGAPGSNMTDADGTSHFILDYGAKARQVLGL